jgi:hypothetical protein
MSEDLIDGHDVFWWTAEAERQRLRALAAEKRADALTAQLDDYKREREAAVKKNWPEWYDNYEQRCKERDEAKVRAASLTAQLAECQRERDSYEKNLADAQSDIAEEIKARQIVERERDGLALYCCGKLNWHKVYGNEFTTKAIARAAAMREVCEAAVAKYKQGHNGSTGLTAAVKRYIAALEANQPKGQ